MILNKCTPNQAHRETDDSIDIFFNVENNKVGYINKENKFTELFPEVKSADEVQSILQDFQKELNKGILKYNELLNDYNTLSDKVHSAGPIQAQDEEELGNVSTRSGKKNR